MEGSHPADREEALAGVEEAFAGFASRSTLPRLRERITAAVGAEIEFAALSLLSRIEAQGPLRTTYLAAQVGLDVSTVSRRIADLEEAGIVARTSDPDDRRAHLLEITPEGRRILASLREVRRSLLGEALTGWSPAEIRELADMLSRFTSALAELA